MGLETDPAFLIELTSNVFNQAERVRLNRLMQDPASRARLLERMNAAQGTNQFPAAPVPHPGQQSNVSGRDNLSNEGSLGR